MDKQQFLDTLKEELLKSQSPETTSDIISDFEEHFTSAVDDDITVEQVCESLGDPIEIAHQFEEEIGCTATSSKKTDIYVDLYCSKVQFIKGEGDHFDVKIMQGLREIDDKRIHITKNGTLSIVEDTPDDFVARILYSHRNRFVKITVPHNFKGSVEIKSLYGDLSFGGIDFTDCVTMINSGNITLNKCNFDNLTINNKWGNVNLKSCSGNISYNGNAGNIKVVDHIGSTNAETVSGNIKVEIKDLADSCKIKTKHGNIKVVTNNISSDITLVAHSGNINLISDDVKANVNCTTTHGNVTAQFKNAEDVFFALESSQMKNDFENVNLDNITVPIVKLSTKHGIVKVNKIT